MLFLNNMYEVFIQTLILAIMIAVGFAGEKIGFFTEKAARMANDLLFYVVTPCVIINSFSNAVYSPEKAKGLLIAFVCAFILHLVSIFVTKFLFNKEDANKSPVYKYACCYGNIGYMGLPLAKAVMQAITGSGDLAVLYCSAAIAVFNIFCFSHGIYTMSRGDTKISLKKLIINPGMLPVLVGIPMFFFNIEFPSIISVPVQSFAAMNTPLAMAMLGTYLAGTRIQDALSNKNIYFCMVFKLIVMPAFLITLFSLCGIKGDTLIAISVFVSVPVATNTTMFAAKYDKDTALASQICGFSTIVSIITLPLCVAYGVMLS